MSICKVRSTHKSVAALIRRAGKGGQWAEIGRRGNARSVRGRGGGKRGGEGGRQRKEGDAGCVRVVPCGIGRSQVRHAFLLRS